MTSNGAQPIENLIEAALFFEGGAVSIKQLASILEKSVEETREGVTSLAASLEGRGLSLVEEGGKVALGTAPSTHALIERMRREELEGPLGKAGLETLAIIIFKGAASRSDIEYIRGVNCSSILRSLLIRGLVERIENPKDKRSFLYQATTELPAYFGVAKLEDLPEYAGMKTGIEAVLLEREALLAKDVAEESPQAE